MPKLIVSFFWIIAITCSCNNQTTENKTQKISIAHDTTTFNGLHGTWVSQTKYSFALIEIKDTANVLYYHVADRKEYNDTITSDRYWYYKSTAKMGYWDSNTIWISTDKFRFDYKLSGDTLIEFDKMGVQGKFIKVYTDEQKAYISFNAAILNGEITYVSEVKPSEYFILNNNENQFTFTSIPNNNSNNKQFSDLAEIGDSVIKPQYSDSLTLIKKQTKKFYKFGFVRRY